MPLDITKLDDNSIIELYNNYKNMLKYAVDKRADPRWQKRMKNNIIPDFNPHFIQMQENVKTEISRRKLEVDI